MNNWMPFLITHSFLMCHLAAVGHWKMIEKGRLQVVELKTKLVDEVEQLLVL